MLEAVAVSWSAAERYATSAEVIWLVVNTSWSGPVRGQRSRERSHEMQVANDVASAKELPSCEARPGRRVNNSAAGKLQGGELREDCVEGALAGGERGVRGV